MKLHTLNKNNCFLALIIAMLVLFAASCSENADARPDKTPGNTAPRQTDSASIDPSHEVQSTYNNAQGDSAHGKDTHDSNTPGSSTHGDNNNGGNINAGNTPEPSAPGEADRLLIFSEEDKREGLDKELKYTKEDLALIKEAEKMYNGQNYSKADELYASLARRNPAWMRDPLLLINWSLTCIHLDKFLEAQAILEEAAERVNIYNDLKELKKQVLEVINTFITKIPRDSEYKSRRLHFLRMAYNLDSDNINSAFLYVSTGLDDMIQDSSPDIRIDQLEHYYNIMESIRLKEWSQSIKKTDFAACYSRIASLYLKTYDARQYLDIIKKCAENVLAIEGADTKNPFLFYLLGIIKQAEGDMEEAVKLVRHAAGIAPNNKDINLWLKAYDPSLNNTARIIKAITPGSINMQNVIFDTYAGTLWLDNEKVLTTIYEPDTSYESGGKSQVQRLFLLDTGTLTYDEIYKGEFIQLHFVTPDKKYVALNDSGKLMIVNLKTKTTRILSSKSYSCSLSPDGNTIAFSDEGIWLYDIKEGTKKKITNSMYDYSPIWYPDGKSILFVGDLGGDDLGGGAGHLQSIFKLSVDNPSDKEQIVDGWESKFHFIEWIIPGEIVHVEQGWDDGFESIILDLYDGSRKSICSLERGEMLYYSASAGNIYMFDGKGIIKRFDVMGNIVSMYAFGDIWGDSFGIIIPRIVVLPDSRGVVFLYGNRLQDNLTLWMADEDFDEPVFISEVPRDYGSDIIISPMGDKLLCGCKQSELEIYSLSQEDLSEYELLEHEFFEDGLFDDDLLENGLLEDDL